jgi:hypothetical protein
MAVELLDQRCSPITDAIGFIEADFARVVSADGSWRASLGGYAGRPVRGALPALLDALLPLTGPLKRYIWVSTAGPWTAYFDNSVLGSDPFGPVSVLAERLSVRGVHIVCRAGTSQRGAAVSFNLYGPEQTDWLNLIRGVRAVEDRGRWEWSATGSIQPFEDESRYQRRRVRDRLTPDVLAAYCGTLGIRPFDSSFYGSNGHMVENTGLTGSIRTETLAQARMSHGLE